MNALKSPLLSLLLFCFIVCTSGCKKDQIVVDTEKIYAENSPASSHPYFSGWSVTLRPDGTADVLPGGDIYYRGTYKINGATLKIKTPQNSATYTFKIISATEIREEEYQTILKLQ